MEDVAASVDRLATQAEQLRDLLAAFETGDEESETLPADENDQPALGDGECRSESDALPTGEAQETLPAADGGRSGG